MLTDVDGTLLGTGSPDASALTLVMAVKVDIVSDFAATWQFEEIVCYDDDAHIESSRHKMFG